MTFITSHPSRFDLAIITTGECSTQRYPIWFSLSLFFFLFNEFHFAPMCCWNKHKSSPSLCLLQRRAKCVYIYCGWMPVFVPCMHACMYICSKDFAHVFTVTTIQSFSMWFGQQLLSPQKPNVLRFCVCHIITVCFAQKVESYLPWSNIKNNYFGLS